MLNVSFKSYPENLDTLIKNKMRENYASLESEVLQKATEEVNNKFKPVFNRQIGKLQAETGKNDLKNILSTLKDAYQNAGLQRDSEVLEKQIRKLDLEV